jgi:Tfp pilus assembly protein PilX
MKKENWIPLFTVMIVITILSFSAHRSILRKEAIESNSKEVIMRILAGESVIIEEDKNKYLSLESEANRLYNSGQISLADKERILSVQWSVQLIPESEN